MLDPFLIMFISILFYIASAFIFRYILYRYFITVKDHKYRFLNIGIDTGAIDTVGTVFFPITIIILLFCSSVIGLCNRRFPLFLSAEDIIKNKYKIKDNNTEELLRPAYSEKNK